jgi:pimeloyl-ACP methyl ester carboxylesterase
VGALLILALSMAGCATTQQARVQTVAVAPMEQEVTLAQPGGTIHGTLLLPAAAGKMPVALIIAGSGPTDRDGNSPLLAGKNNSLRYLAEGLAARGVASVRYDKRGIGASVFTGFTEKDLKFTNYSDDAAAWIAQLRKDARFNKVIVIGHSEGAMLGTIAAHQANADGLILIAGAGRPIGEVLREQLRNNAPALVDVAEPVLKELEAGHTVATVPPALVSLFRPSIQPYMISWLPLDPKTELARVKAPRLVVQGTTDVQASVADAQRLATADKSVQLELIDGMNHILKMASGTAAQQMASSYGDPALPIAPRLMDVIIRFIDAKIR